MTARFLVAEAWRCGAEGSCGEAAALQGHAAVDCELEVGEAWVRLSVGEAGPTAYVPAAANLTNHATAEACSTAGFCAEAAASLWP